MNSCPFCKKPLVHHFGFSECIDSKCPYHSNTDQCEKEISHRHKNFDLDFEEAVRYYEILEKIKFEKFEETKLKYT